MYSRAKNHEPRDYPYKQVHSTEQNTTHAGYNFPSSDFLKFHFSFEVDHFNGKFSSKHDTVWLRLFGHQTTKLNVEKFELRTVDMTYNVYGIPFVLLFFSTEIQYQHTPSFPSTQL